MNILYIALLVCVVRHVFASEGNISGVDKQVVPGEVVGEEEDVAGNFEVQEFVEAVQKGDMRTAYFAFPSYGSDKLKEYCGEHLVNLGMSKLVELTKGAVYKSWMLRVILMYSGKALFDEVSAKTNPTDDDLSGVAFSADLASDTDKLFYLLGKLTGEYQERAVKFAAAELVVANKIEHLDHMLSELESKPSLGSNMVNIAIRKAFETASLHKHGRVLIARYFDHPAILAEDFFKALYRFYSFEDPKNVIFYRFLAQADRQDLEEVRNENLLPRRSPKFQNAVIKALKAVGPDTRIGIRRRRAETIKSLTGLFPKDLFDIIFGYHFGW